MSVESHIQKLQQRHRSLEEQLSQLSAAPSVSDRDITNVKREKLRLKDAIAKLESAS